MVDVGIVINLDKELIFAILAVVSGSLAAYWGLRRLELRFRSKGNQSRSSSRDKEPPSEK